MYVETADNPLTKTNCSNKHVLVLGLGNILLRDEGIGVRVVEQLQKQSLPSNIDVIDGGTASLDVLLLAQNIDKLVIIDALKAGNKPGSIYKASFDASQRKEIENAFEHDCKISLHQMGLIDALAAAEKTNCAPKEIVIIGVEPQEIDYGLELTDEVKKKIPEIVSIVLKEIKDAIDTE